MWVSEWKDWKIFAYNMPLRNLLESLQLDGIDLGFLPGRFDYAVRVPNTTTTITVAATPAFDDATAVIAPPDADSAADGHQINLETGDNTITVTVTAPNGADTETYTVTVTRAVG